MKTITLENLAESSEQEVFDFIATHMLTQKAKAQVEGSNKCVYRSKDGLACAAGCLLTDEQALAFDNRRFQEKATSWSKLLHENLVPSAHGRLIARLQNIHDDYPVSEWLDRLVDLSQDMDLATTVLPL